MNIGPVYPDILVYKKSLKIKKEINASRTRSTRVMRAARAN